MHVAWAEITVRLAMENAILKKDNSDLQAQIRKQDERGKSGNELCLRMSMQYVLKKSTMH